MFSFFQLPYFYRKLENKQFYGTVGNVKEINKNTITLLILQWNENELIKVNKDYVLNNIESNNLESGDRLFLKCNLKARKKEDLILKDFEKAPEPKPLDEL